MKAFNLKEALAGKPVVTRDGRPATQLFHFDVPEYTDPYCLHGVVEGRIETWNKDGIYYTSNLAGSAADLFMVGTKKEGWVNIYSFHSKACSGIVYATKEEATEQRTSLHFLDCVRVEWEA